MQKHASMIKFKDLTSSLILNLFTKENKIRNEIIRKNGLKKINPNYLILINDFLLIT